MGCGPSKDCVFCDILQNKKNEDILYEDDLVFAFNDIQKRSAREHILVCPKEHIPNVNTLLPKHLELLQHMKKVGNEILDKIDPEAERKYPKCVCFNSLGLDFMSLLFIQ